MEYVRVSFVPGDIRDVIANGNVVGSTETELALPANYYVISLSGAGYSPSHRYVLVTGTSPAEPLPIRFDRV
ncbi:MAG: hypothetical protein ACREE2_10795 [Stellaceae bacterium]